MALVDIEEKYYPCPHCDGFIRLRVQYPDNGPGCSISVYHVTIHKGMDGEVNLEEHYELHGDKNVDLLRTKYHSAMKFGIG